MTPMLEARGCSIVFVALFVGGAGIAGGCGDSPSGDAAAGPGTTGVQSATTAEGDIGTGGASSSGGVLGTETGQVQLDCEPVGVDRIELPEDVLVVEDPETLLQFCGVREIEGHLWLGNEDASVDWGGLAVLAHLEVIGGLTLGHVDEPVAFPSLRSAEFITLHQPGSVAAPLLPRLRDAGSVFVGPHATAVDLSGLESARELRVGGDMILDALTELQGFEVTSDVVSLPEAPQLERISGAVQLVGAERLTDLALLRNVRTIEGAFELDGLTSLASLLDLSALERVGKPDAAGTDTFPSGGFRLYAMDALPSLAGLEQLAVIHGDIEIGRENRSPSLEGLQGVTAWRADARPNVTTWMGINGEGEGVEPDERNLLDWLKTAELPSRCAIEVEMPPSKVKMVDFDPELAALCEG